MVVYVSRNYFQININWVKNYILDTPNMKNIAEKNNPFWPFSEVKREEEERFRDDNS